MYIFIYIYLSPFSPIGLGYKGLACSSSGRLPTVFRPFCRTMYRLTEFRDMNLTMM